MTSLTVVITTYKRPVLVQKAILSALEFCQQLPQYEIIVVDDASGDDTPVQIRSSFGDEISSGKLRLFVLDTNGGVNVAKNYGFNQAQYEWVGFLDSDDIFLSGSTSEFIAASREFPDTPIIFFKCVSTSGNIIGTTFSEPQQLDFERYLKHTSYGEAITFFNRNRVASAPYDSDLRGFEGLGCLRIIRQYGPAVLWPRPLRIYSTDTPDRLSGMLNMLRRSDSLYRGFKRLRREFHQDMRFGQTLSIAAKEIRYGLLSVIFSWFGKR